LSDQGAWIFYPTEVQCLVSKDNKTFKTLPIQKINSAEKNSKLEIKTIEFKITNANYKYIKIVAKKLGKVPKWHVGYPYDGSGWIFVDEISIK
jgi:hypothetical protein